ncbi:MAG: SH3 domain-containing protein [Acidimicrobiia bacterium]|nr:SH3 domain-containing protein [Acidimicrobiia bacterium]
MSIEERLRSALAQRAESVETSPGALFEIQRRIAQRRRVLRVARLPELRLRPALVLAAAACATIAVVVSVSVRGPAPPPIQTDTQPVAGTAEPAVVAPTTVEPPPQGPAPTPPLAQTAPQPNESGQLTTAAEPPSEVAATPPSDPPPATDAAASEAADDEATNGEDSGEAAGDDEAVATETQGCPAAPADAAEPSAGWVTVYFACEGNDAAPRLRAADDDNLLTALKILLGGPDEADRADGFRGLSAASPTTVTTATTDRWVTIDLPAGLANSFGAGDGGITARQFLSQLNATVFHSGDFEVAEYRLGGDCAAFGSLLGASCQIHLRDGDGYASRTSDLTAHTIGRAASVVRAEPDDSAAEFGVLRDGTRLTDGRAGNGRAAWAEVVTASGDRGWVSTQTIVAQPLALDAATAARMADLARRLTTGPGLESSALVPAGLVLRWGAGGGDLAVVSTADAALRSDWWHTAVDTPSPRDGSAQSSLADLLWIDGQGDGATVTVNAPGPLGEPHGDFTALAYVSIYRPAIEGSTLPPPLATSAPEQTTPTSEGPDLPPVLPSLSEGNSDAGEQPPPPRAQISVIFDFLSPDGPRVAAAEAIWIQP